MILNIIVNEEELYDKLKKNIETSTEVCDTIKNSNGALKKAIQTVSSK